MRKFLSFVAFALLSVSVALSFSACGDDDDDVGTPSFPDKTFTVDGVTFKMIAVEGGTFQMGSGADEKVDTDEKPRHAVTLSNYLIGATEVTQALWEAVMGSNPSNIKGDNLPVENFTLYDCQEFIKKLNQKTGQTFRLPTEAEWEYAARGGNKSKGYKYSGSDDLDAVAWYKDNCNKSIHAVGTKQANELGIYDMSGNVWEWCHDLYGNYSSEAQTNPKGPVSGSKGYVIRGGSLYSVEGECSVTYRFYNWPEFPEEDLGLRLAL